jgi:hypothetical protein
MKSLQLIAAVLLFAGTAAFAQTSRYTATLAQPLAAKKEIIVNRNIWRCEGNTCVLASVPDDPGSIRDCHALMRKVGALTAYGSEGRSFEPDKLAKCNDQG